MAIAIAFPVAKPSENCNCPEPSVVNLCPLVPSAVGSLK